MNIKLNCDTCEMAGICNPPEMAIGCLDEEDVRTRILEKGYTPSELMLDSNAGIWGGLYSKMTLCN